MTTDLDIYRTAAVLIREHGEEADLVAAQRADKFLEDGKLYYEKRSYELALQNFLDALELDQNNPETNYYLGIVYARMGKYEWAADYLQKVRDSELTFLNKIHSDMILGYIYTIQERYDDALELFRGILRLGLESAQAYAAIGFIMDRQGVSPSS